MPSRPGKVSYGSPGDVAANGGIVVVEADARNFGYWHVAPSVQAGTHVSLHGLLGHIAAQPEDWGHVHFAESTHDRNGITYWNPLRPGALSPFYDYGPPVIEAIIASLPPNELHGLVDLSVKAHDNTPIAVTQPKPPGWHGMPVTPARIRWRLTRTARRSCPGRSSSTTAAHSDRTSTEHHRATPTSPPIYTPDTTQNNPNTPGNYHFWLTRRFNTNDYPDGAYHLEVEASDVRGNPRTAALEVTFNNAG